MPIGLAYRNIIELPNGSRIDALWHYEMNDENKNNKRNKFGVLPGLEESFPRRHVVDSFITSIHKESDPHISLKLELYGMFRKK